MILRYFAWATRAMMRPCTKVGEAGGAAGLGRGASCLRWSILLRMKDWDSRQLRTQRDNRRKKKLPKIGIIVAGVTFICSEVLPSTWAELECRSQTLQDLRSLQLCTSGLGGVGFWSPLGEARSLCLWVCRVVVQQPKATEVGGFSH